MITENLAPQEHPRADSLPFRLHENRTGGRGRVFGKRIDPAPWITLIGGLVLGFAVLIVLLTGVPV